MTKLTPIQTTKEISLELSCSIVIIPLGYPGILVDYEKDSGDPIVEFYESILGIVSWENITIVSECTQVTDVNQQLKTTNPKVYHERTC